jgi:hypothetical protein
LTKRDSSLTFQSVRDEIQSAADRIQRRRFDKRSRRADMDPAGMHSGGLDAHADGGGGVEGGDEPVEPAVDHDGDEDVEADGEDVVGCSVDCAFFAEEVAAGFAGGDELGDG